jgi:SAM-dependent methyltransferase
MQEQAAMKSPDWSGSSGDIWARRWRDTDRALGEVGAALDQAILEAAPEGPFRALDIGCGPGTTTLALAERRGDAEILGCDLSRSLVDIAKRRWAGPPNVRFAAIDAEQAARDDGPFDLLFSRHGVMFFDDPARAFANLRAGTATGGRLVFSCFREWSVNPWAAELASAAADRELPPPGREPSGFAFADPAYVAEILSAAGWTEAEPRPLDFDYDAGSSDEALSFLAELGPAARVLEELDEEARPAAIERMGAVIDGHDRGGRVIFPGAAWIWTARAG